MNVERKALSHQLRYSNERRKLQGVHYTPDMIIEYIIRRILQPYFEKGDSKLIQDIAILDPACGSGLFLLKAFDILCSFWRQYFGSLRPKDVRYILENNLYGVDIDASAVQATKDNLTRKAQEFRVENIDLEHKILQGDALMWPASYPQQEMAFNVEESAEAFHWWQEFPQIFARGGFDCIIGNPPYIRIQHIQPLERRRRYVELYETARGRFDIAGLFIELANYLAKPGGRIGYIVSNKILSTNSASDLRDYILDHSRLVEIIDLADTKLFEAAVLPMILILEKNPAQVKSFVYGSIQEIKTSIEPPLLVEHLLAPLELNQLPLRTDVEWKGRRFRIEKYEPPPPTGDQRVWTFHFPTDRNLIKKIKNNTFCTLESIAYKISVGLKTTADNVFIKSMRLDFIKRHNLEREIIFRVLESHNVKRWRCDWKPERDLYVLYPHREQNGKVIPVCLDRYPNIERYLLSNRRQLEARTYMIESGRQWYEIWVHQSPKDFQQLKLITPDIAPRNTFALDDRKFFVNGTCFYIILKNQSLEYNLLILAFLNSKVLEFFHKVTSRNVLYAKRYRYWTSNLKPYPIPDIADPRNSSAVRRLVENTRMLVKTTSEQEIIALQEENNRLIYNLFKLTDQEVKELECSLVS